MDFDKADKTVHPVEKQWHYQFMMDAGYKAETAEARGFVRQYFYTHPDTRRRFKICTGVNSDYWIDLKIKKYGHWTDLKGHLESI